MKNIVLLLTDAELQIYGDDLELLAQKDLTELVQRYPAAQYFLLLDVADEVVIQEPVARLSRADISKLKARRLTQLFPSTQYRQARLLRRGSRHQAGCLQFTALNCQEKLDAVLAELSGVALAGVYSVPLLLQEMLGELQCHASNFLLIASQPGALRQCYFSVKAGRAMLQFTRLAKIQALPSADNLWNEIDRVRQYLLTSGQLIHGEPAVLVLDAPTAALVEGEIEPYFLLADVVPGALPEQGLHDLVLRQLLFPPRFARRPSNQYAPAAMMKLHTAKIRGRGLLLSALLVFALSAILSVFNWRAAAQAQRATETITLDADKLRLQQLHAKLAQASEPARLQASVDLYHRHMLSAAQPDTYLQALSVLWRDFPLLVLNEVRWQVAAPEITATSRGAATLWLSGQLSQPLAHRDALAQIDLLVQRLQRWRGARVAVQQWPLDVRSSAAINALPDATKTEKAPQFVLQIDLGNQAVSARSMPEEGR